MFNSLLQFLPPGLTPGEKTSPAGDDTTPHAEAVNKEMGKGAEEQTQKKRKDRTNESFIVVRPPPSKTNHPLNLQVQLVPPSSRDPVRPSSSAGSTHSVDTTTSSTGELTLSRTSSNRSDTSAYSAFSSTTSISSSASSTTSGRRMIIPLYNLQAHNVMQNVIVDAGTDAKVAKFMRRGLEIIGLAVLEPVEVWGPPGSFDVWARSGPALGEQAPRRSGDFAPSMTGPVLSTEPAHTPTSPGFSFHSVEATVLTPAMGSSGFITPTTPTTPTAGERTPKGGKLFGRLFKKRADSSPTSSPANSRPSSTFVPPPSPLAGAPGGSLKKRTSLHMHAPSGGAPDERTAILQPPVLGIQPVLSSAVVPPMGRPGQYVWVVRRWLKGSPESVLSGVKDLLPERERDKDRRGTGIEALVEVRFEWTRGKRARKRRRGAGEGEGEASRERGRGVGGSKRSSVARSDSPSSGEQGATSAQSHHSQRQPPASPTAARGVRKQRSTLSPGRSPRRSIDSLRSTSPHPPASILTNTTEMDDHEPADGSDGEDSDPEDSETPWTCTLVVRRLPSVYGHARNTSVGMGQPGSKEEKEKPIRLTIARVTPTPHHPKVVALLKIPFPLPDVEVDRVHLRKRIVTPAGVARPALSTSGKDNGRPSTATGGSGGSGIGKGFWNQQQPREGLVLTAEEIKDVISSTGLWLVVREAFGGVGRVNRKGDGWKLRG